MSQGDTLFPALLAGIAELRARVEGTDAGGGGYRARLLQLQGQDGLVPAVSKAVLEAVAEILAWLYRAIDAIDELVVQADAALALVGVLGATIQGLGEALDQEWPAGLARAGAVAQGLTSVGGLLAQVDGVELPAIIPRPATLLGIQAETRALLGTRVDAQADPASGSLADLLQALGANP